MRQLILVTGPPCSGKSTVAAALAARVDAIVLDIDEIRKILMPHSKQSQQDRDIAYRCMHLIAEKLFEAGGKRVVVAATYMRRQPRQWLRSMADRSGADVCAIACKVSPETAVARFRFRDPGHAAIDLTEKMVREEATDYEFESANIVDGDLPVHDAVAKAEFYARTARPTDIAEWTSHGAVNT